MRSRPYRRAAILVLTLWMIVVLGMISSSMLEEVHLELRLAQFQKEDFEAQCLARAGLARAIADLRNDLTIDHTSQGEAFDALGDIWARGDENKLGRENKGVEMGRGRYFVWVDDEAAKLDLNTVALNVNPTPNPNASLLRALLLEVGLNEKQVAEVAAAITDYRDADPGGLATPPGTGLEEEYYSKGRDDKDRESSGETRRSGFRCKNDRLSTVEELLSIPGVTPKIYYGVDPEKEEIRDPIEQLHARLDDTRSQRSRQRKVGLRDLVAIRSEPNINVNTAPREVLQVLFRAVMQNPKQAEMIANNIVLMRKPDARGHYSNEGAIKNIAELGKIQGMPMNLLPQLTALAPLVVRSDCYRIWALGEVGKSRRMICASVQRSYERCQSDQLVPLFESGAIRQRLAERFYRRYGRERTQIEQSSVRVVQWQEY